MSSLQSCLAHAATGVRHRARYQKSFVNKPKLVEYGLRALAESEWRIFLTDKDGGFAVASKKDEEGMHRDILSKDWYEIPRVRLSNTTAIMNDYFSVANRAAEVEDDSEVKNLIPKSANNGTLISKLRPALKPKGAVVGRPFHFSNESGFEGLAAYVSVAMRAELDKCDYLVKNSEAIVQDLGGTKAEDTDFCVKGDAEDFYFSGECGRLAADASSIVPVGPKQTLVKNSLKFLLRNQYIDSEVLDVTAKCVRGSGMGLRHSRDTADDAYLCRVEKWATSPQIKSIFKIKSITGSRATF